MADDRITPKIVLDATPYGLTGICWVVIGILVGLLLITKYFKYKDKMLLYVGINIALLTSPWWPSSISYILALFGLYLEDVIYGFLLYGIITFDFLLWLYVFTGALYKEKQKMIMILGTIYTIIAEIIIISFCIIDVKGLIMERENLIDISFRLALIIIAGINTSLFMITFIIFARDGLKSPNPETRLKGKLALVFIVFFGFGTLLDGFLEGIQYALIARIALILGVIFLYMVFELPEWLKRRIKD